MTRRWLVGLAAIALAAATVAVAGGATGSKRAGLRLAAARTKAAPCSEKSPEGAQAPTWPAARKELAPPGASAIRLCDYSGLNATPPLALTRSLLLSAPSLVRRLLSELDRLPRGLQGAHTCPADKGQQIVALLAYPSGHRVTVRLAQGGCRDVSNGSVTRSAIFGSGPKLLHHVYRLLAGGRGP